MNIPAYSLLIACLLPIVAAGMQKWGARDYDNHNPRQWAQHMEDPRRHRALAARWPRSHCPTQPLGCTRRTKDAAGV